MIPKVQAVKRDLRDLTITVIYSDNTTETYMDGYSQLEEIKNGLTKNQVHQIVNLSKTTILKATSYNDDDFDTKYRQTYLGDWTDKTSGTPSGTDALNAGLDALRKLTDLEDIMDDTGTASATAQAMTSGTVSASAKTSGGNVFVGAPFDSQSFDPLRARVGAAGAYVNSPWGVVVMPDFSGKAKSKAAKSKANSVYGKSLGTASHTSAPWEDPLKKDTVACIDLPELKPYHDPNAEVKVYYQDRYPTIPIRAIIDDAIEILNKHKGLHISKISFCQSHPEFQLVIKGRSPYDKNYTKTLEVMINHRAFERFSHEIDKSAKLKAKWDTNTYIKMRIAYLLYKGMMLGDYNAPIEANFDIFRVIGSNTRPDFTL